MSARERRYKREEEDEKTLPCALLTLVCVCINRLPRWFLNLLLYGARITTPTNTQLKYSILWAFGERVWVRDNESYFMCVYGMRKRKKLREYSMETENLLMGPIHFKCQMSLFGFLSRKIWWQALARVRVRFPKNTTEMETSIVKVIFYGANAV